MIPLQILMQHRTLSPTEVNANIWSYADVTPAATFNYFVLPVSDGKRLLCAPFKTGGKNLAPTVLKTAALVDGEPPNYPLCLLSCNEVAPFDTIAIVSFEAHSQFQTFDQGLHQATSIVFPIYRCEFKGDESPDLIRMIRRDFLPSLEWERKPHPTVRAAFDNPQLGLRSQRMECLLISLADTFSVLKQMDGHCLSWLRVQNWRKEELVIKFKEDFSWAFIWPDHREFTLNSVSEAICRLEEFCTT